MTTITEAFGQDTTVGKVIEITEKMDTIQRALDRIRYDEALFAELPGVVEKLAAAKDACVNELRSL